MSDENIPLPSMPSNENIPTAVLGECQKKLNSNCENFFPLLNVLRVFVNATDQKLS